MKKIFCLVAVALSIISVKAQKVVSLHHNGIATMFNSGTPVIDAYAAAADKDTIYIPGGYFSFPGTIAKRLVIIGAGHYPDSTQATTKTIINGGFTFTAGSDSSFISGIEVSGAINFDYWSIIKGVRITRARFSSSSINGNSTYPKTGLIFHESIFSYIDGGGVAPYLTVSNCIVTNWIGNISGNALIQNNVFLWEMGCGGCGAFPIQAMDNSLIQNNIFYGNMPWYISGNNNNVFNNLFASTPLVYTNTYINNYINIGQSNLLSSASIATFNYTDNYHLQSPTTYLGTDGTQVGLYGGTFGSYKDGAVPVNPHIYYKSVSPTTDASGNLNIIFKVSAQTK